MCNAILEEIESLMDANAEVIAKKINLLQAIQFWRDAWDSVSKEAIQNCWKKAQLKEWQGMTSEFVDDEQGGLELLNWIKCELDNVRLSKI